MEREGSADAIEPRSASPRALAAEFEARFGARPSAAARAPGRVNLIGEHTDYNQGLALPCAVDLDTLALVAPRAGGRVRLWSREAGPAPEFAANAPRRRGDWSDYVQGVVFSLREGGMPVAGFDLLVASRVPEGAGLSSSAALGVAVVTALDAAFGLRLAPRDRARVAHRAETGFAGVACGILDPIASALGRRGFALRLDCRDESVTEVPLPEAARLVVVDSGVRRRLADGRYAERVAECRAALLAARGALRRPGLGSLRDVSPADLAALEAALPPTLWRRLRHVVTENARVDAACAALAAGDLAAVGATLREGQASLRDDYQVSTPELDALCRLADALPGVCGSRLTGAGFGGCSLHLVAADACAEAAAGLAAGFERRFGRRPRLWVLASADGAGPEQLSDP
jgi:galactokinase